MLPLAIIVQQGCNSTTGATCASLNYYRHAININISSPPNNAPAPQPHQIPFRWSAFRSAVRHISDITRHNVVPATVPAHIQADTVSPRAPTRASMLVSRRPTSTSSLTAAQPGQKIPPADCKDHQVQAHWHGVSKLLLICGRSRESTQQGAAKHSAGHVGSLLTTSKTRWRWAWLAHHYASDSCNGHHCMHARAAPSPHLVTTMAAFHRAVSAPHPLPPITEAPSGLQYHVSQCGGIQAEQQASCRPSMGYPNLIPAALLLVCVCLLVSVCVRAWCIQSRSQPRVGIVHAPSR
jgi:hypothetical protein